MGQGKDGWLSGVELYCDLKILKAAHKDTQSHQLPALLETER